MCLRLHSAAAAGASPTPRSTPTRLANSFAAACSLDSHPDLDMATMASTPHGCGGSLSIDIRFFIRLLSWAVRGGRVGTEKVYGRERQGGATRGRALRWKLHARRSGRRSAERGFLHHMSVSSVVSKPTSFRSTAQTLSSISTPAMANNGSSLERQTREHPDARPLLRINVARGNHGRLCHTGHQHVAMQT